MDRKLRGAPIHVLCYLYATRKYGGFQSIKYLEVAEMIHINRQRVGQALHTLVQEGYLREGPRLERNIGSYMLLIARDGRVKRSA